MIVAQKGTVMDLTPPAWSLAASAWLGGIIGSILITRSAAKKKLEAAISDATEQLKDSNRNLLESQIRELTELRTEISGLRLQVDTLTDMNQSLITLNQRYGAALAEKDMRIGELERDVRVRDQRIMNLETRNP